MSIVRSLATLLVFGGLVAAPAAHAVPPPPPADVAVTATSDSSVRVTWQPAAGAVRYAVNQYTPSNVLTALGFSTGTSKDVARLTAGTYRYQVCSVNADGERGCPSLETLPSVTVAGDRTLPQVTLTGLPADGIATGTLRVTLAASDDVRLRSIKLLLDGEHILCASAPGDAASATCSGDVDSAGLADGAHVLRAEATDWNGNLRATEETVDARNPLSSSYLAGYGFEDGPGATAADGSGRGNTGEVLGATWTPGGRLGGALSFDGANDRVDLPSLRWGVTRHGFTLEAWVRKTSTKRDVAVVGSWTGTDNGGPMLWADNLFGRWTGTVAKGAPTYVDSGRTPWLNAWQHLAVTYDGATARFYLDGVEVASRAYSGSIGGAEMWRIGAYGAGPVGFFDGVIDEVRIFKRPLTAAEVQATMDLSVAIVEPPEPPAAPQDIIANATPGRVALQWSPADGATKYAVHRSGTPGFTPDASNRVGNVDGTSFTDTGLEPGRYHYRVRAGNAFGDFGPASEEVAVDVPRDETPPQIELRRPAPGAVVKGDVALQAATGDDGAIASVRFEIDGHIVVTAEPGDGAYGATWSSVEVPNGDHRIRAVARDAVGNEARTDEIAFTVDNPSALVAHYTFDDGAGVTAADSSGRQHDALVEQGAMWTTEGKRGGALSFDGFNDRVTLPELGGFNFHDGFTLEAWVKKRGSKRDVAVVGSWASPRGGGPMIWVDHLVGRYRLTTERVFAEYLDSTRTPAIGQWQHLAATYDGTTARFFVDGSEVASKIADTLGLGQYWRIGAYGPGQEGFFDGMIDDVRIYSRPLTGTEIREDLGGGTGEEPPQDTTPPTAPAGLRITGATTRSVTLAWSGSSDDTSVSGYAVYRDGEPAGTPVDPAIKVEGLECERTYRIAVEARDPAGNTSERAAIDATTAECPPLGLVAAYSFAGNALDDSRNGNDGTYGNNLGFGAGRYGLGAWLNGSSTSRIDLPALGTFHRTAFTLEAWVQRSPQSTTGDNAIVGTWVSGLGGGPMLWVDHVDRRYRLTLGKGWSAYLDSGRRPADGQWEHVAGTFDGSTARFYLNGEEVASGAFTATATSNQWHIGAYGSSDARFKGIIDEVRIYDRALSATEVRADMDTPIAP